MINFITCPFCAGGESVSPEATDALAWMIEEHLRGKADSPLDVELSNIRNAILNVQERAAAIDPLLA